MANGLAVTSNAGNVTGFYLGLLQQRQSRVSKKYAQLSIESTKALNFIITTCTYVGDAVPRLLRNAVFSRRTKGRFSLFVFNNCAVYRVYAGARHET